MPETQNKISRSTPLTPKKKAMVVGASGGIGTALARKLAQEGYALALVDRNQDALSALCDELNQGVETRAVLYIQDVTEYKKIPALFRRAVADLGGIDLFV